MTAGISLLLVLSSVFNPLPAAEDSIRGSTATTIPHPELAPTGIGHGGFTIFPSFIYSLNFVDNVFATDNNIESSYVSELIPTIAVNSNWNNHALNFNFSSAIGVNHSFSSEDYNDWNLEADGIIDISRDTSFAAGAGLGREHIPRTAPDDERGVEPTEFDRASIFARYAHKSGRLVGRINLNLVRKEYMDVDAIRFGIPITLDNSDRDRSETSLRFRAGYQYVGNEQVFFSLEGNDRDYDRSRNFSGRDQSSNGLEAMFGASFDYHGILLGEASLGYRDQDYRAPLRDIATPLAEAGISWNVTDLTTVEFSLDHRIRESIDLVFSGYTSTTAALNLDHELRRNLVVNLSLRFTRDDYIGIDPADREDKAYNIIAGATYKMNRNLFFTGQFVHEQRNSRLNATLLDSSRFDFSRNLISFQLQAQF